VGQHSASRAEEGDMVARSHRRRRHATDWKKETTLRRGPHGPSRSKLCELYV
jgi:hypothetical protein